MIDVCTKYEYVLSDSALDFLGEIVWLRLFQVISQSAMYCDYANATYFAFAPRYFLPYRGKIVDSTPYVMSIRKAVRHNYPQRLPNNDPLGVIIVYLDGVMAHLAPSKTICIPLRYR